MSQIVREIIISGERIRCTEVLNKKENKYCTECRALIEKDQVMVRRLFKKTSRYEPGSFCKLKCLISREEKRMLKIP